MRADALAMEYAATKQTITQYLTIVPTEINGEMRRSSSSDVEGQWTCSQRRRPSSNVEEQWICSQRRRTSSDVEEPTVVTWSSTRSERSKATITDRHSSRAASSEEPTKSYIDAANDSESYVDTSTDATTDSEKDELDADAKHYSTWLWLSST